MTTGIIEINDAGLRFAAEGEVRASSPGYAVLDGSRLLTGTEARANAKLLPRWTNNRFWNQLSTDPIPNGTDTVRHHADLAFTHLESVWNANGTDIDRVVFAVPGFYSREQLGLLLGMAKECGIPVAGIVDSSVAATVRHASTPTILHLDIFLHRITLSVLKVDTSLRRVANVTVSETGMFTLLDRWANIIAGQFIQTSRYDPMHQATSEQVLFDALPAWIAERAEARSSAFVLNVDSNRHEVAVSQEQLLQACAAVYPQIVQLVRDNIPAGETATLVVADRFRGFPGLTDSLNLIGNADTVFASADAVSDGVADNVAHIISDDGAISHTTTLPVSGTVRHVTTSGNRPTHALTGHRATAIGSALKVCGIADGALIREGTPLCTLFERGGETLLDAHAGEISINGQPASGTATLAAGDVVTVDGQSMTLIIVD